jgi:hypothetical protein
LDGSAVTEAEPEEVIPKEGDEVTLGLDVNKEERVLESVGIMVCEPQLLTELVDCGENELFLEKVGTALRLKLGEGELVGKREEVQDAEIDALSVRELFDVRDVKGVAVAAAEEVEQAETREERLGDPEDEEANDSVAGAEADPVTEDDVTDERESELEEEYDALFEFDKEAEVDSDGDLELRELREKF